MMGAMRRVRPSHALGASLAAAQVAYGLDAPRPPWMTRAIVALYLTTSTADAVEQRGPRGAAVVAAAGSIGFGAELLGVRTGKPFGPYDYSGQLGRKVADVPLMAAAAWALLARPSRIAGQLATGRRRGVAPVVAAAAALTAWDAFLDPRMVREGYWRWPGGGRYEGIPASNYAGWFATGLAIFGAASVIDPADDALAVPSHGAADGSGASAPGERAGDTALAIYTWTWIGELIANVLLWKRPRVAAVGGIAMGAIAIPALLTRVRAARAAPERREPQQAPS